MNNNPTPPVTPRGAKPALVNDTATGSAAPVDDPAPTPRRTVSAIFVPGQPTPQEQDVVDAADALLQIPKAMSGQAILAESAASRSRRALQPGAAVHPPPMRPLPAEHTGDDESLPASEEEDATDEESDAVSDESGDSAIHIASPRIAARAQLTTAVIRQADQLLAQALTDPQGSDQKLLDQLKRHLGSWEKTTQYLWQTGQFQLLVSMVLLLDTSYPALTRHAQRRLADPTGHVVRLLRESSVQGRLDEDAFVEFIRKCELKPSDLLVELQTIENSNARDHVPGIRRLARDMRNELLYGQREVIRSIDPMSCTQLGWAAAKAVLNAARSGTTSLLGRLAPLLIMNSVRSLGANAGWLFMSVPAMCVPLISLRYLTSRKSDVYKEHPSRSFQAAEVCGYVVPIAFPVIALGATGVAAGRLAVENNATQAAWDYLSTNITAEGSALVVDAASWAGAASAGAEVLALGALAKGFREALHSASVTPATTSLALRHADGSGLAAGEQMKLNIIKDALYAGTCVLILGVGAQAARRVLLEALGSSTSPLVKALGEAAATVMLSVVVDLLESSYDDVSKVIFVQAQKCLGIKKQVMLQPGQARWGWGDWTELKTQAACRVVLGTPSDLFAALADAADVAVAPPWVGQALRGTGSLAQGTFNGLRKRLVIYVATDKSITQDGTKNPAGLMSWMVGGTRDGVASACTSRDRRDKALRELDGDDTA